MGVLKIRQGVWREIRTSPKMMKIVGEAAESVRDKAMSGYQAGRGERNPGYAVIGPYATGGRGRARAVVMTGTTRSVKREITEHALLKAVGATHV